MSADTGFIPVWVEFVHGAQGYLVDAYGHESLEAGQRAIYRLDNAGGARLVGGAVSVYDPDALQWSAQIPREALWDEHGATPGTGSVFRDFHVTTAGTQVYFGMGGEFYLRDVAPNAGGQSPELTFTYGLEQSPAYTLTSRSAARASNGEATAFVFPVNATNLDGRSHEFGLSATDLPAGWEIRLPRPVFTLAAGESLEQAAIVTIPFAHGHGSFESVTLELRSEDQDLGHSALHLGVRFHDVPQPAGHHDTLWIHSQDEAEAFPGEGLVVADGTAAYMNTLQDDPMDANVPVRATHNHRPIEEFRWTIRLQPSLGMGLALDASQSGSLELELNSPVPVQAGTLDASLRVTNPEDAAADHILATGAVSGLDLMPNQPTALDVPLDVQLGRLPYQETSQLYLDLVLTGTVPTAVTASEVPQLMPGAQLRMPFLEYREHEPVDLFSPAGFTVEAITSPQRLANPGDTLVHSLRITNNRSAPIDLELTLDGVQKDWLEPLLSPALRLDAGEQRDLHVISRIPADAQQGDVSDFVVLASGSGGQGIVRFVTEVDEEQLHPDDVARANELLSKTGSNKAPPVPLALVVLSLLVILYRKR